VNCAIAVVRLRTFALAGEVGPPCDDRAALANRQPVLATITDSGEPRWDRRRCCCDERAVPAQENPRRYRDDVVIVWNPGGASAPQPTTVPSDLSPRAKE